MLSESECSARFGEKLDKFESGDLPSVTAKVLSAFTKRKVSGIKSGGFNAEVKDDRAKSIRCSLKAAEGFLYPLDKAFFFLSNKPVLVELDRVASVEFNRVDASGTANAARTFDITVHMKDMSSDLQFVNLQRSEYKELFRFLTAKKLRIKNIASSSYADGGRGDDDDDDDPYMARMQKEREAALAAEAEDDDDDDDDESDDEDFVAGDDSDVDEEYDEGDEEDDERMEKREKGKKDKGGSSSAPPKKRSRDDDASGSDDDDDDDSSGSEEEEKKPAKKGKKAMGIMGKKGASPKKKKAKKDADAPKARDHRLHALDEHRGARRRQGGEPRPQGHGGGQAVRRALEGDGRGRKGAVGGEGEGRQGAVRGGDEGVQGKGQGRRGERRRADGGGERQRQRLSVHGAG